MAIWLIKMLLLAGLPVVILVVLCAYKRTRKFGFGLLSAYTVIYVILSLNGQYVARDLSGGIGVVAPLSTEVAYYWWCPPGFGKPFGKEEKTGIPIMEGGAELSALFWPLHRLDRLLFHRTKPNTAWDQIDD